MVKNQNELHFEFLNELKAFILFLYFILLKQSSQINDQKSDRSKHFLS